MAYDFDGRRYAQASTPQKEWGTKLIDGLDLQGSERILDLGCGDGAVSAELARRVPQGQVLGIDASPGMLDAARRHSRDNLRFELLNIDDLSDASEFDVVFSNATLHFVKDHRRLLGNIHRALRDGGVVRCNFGAAGNCKQFFEVVRETMRSPEFSSFFQDFEWPYFMPEIDAYRVLVGEFPFLESKVWGEDADRYFPDEEAMTQWIDQPSIVPFLQRLDEPYKQPFRDTVVSRAVAQARREDGTCFQPFRRVNLWARK